jgi:hypothetical protein
MELLKWKTFVGNFCPENWVKQKEGWEDDIYFIRLKDKCHVWYAYHPKFIEDITNEFPDYTFDSHYMLSNGSIYFHGVTLRKNDEEIAFNFQYKYSTNELTYPQNELGSFLYEWEKKNGIFRLELLLI